MDVDRLAAILREHRPTTGQRVAMGETCLCGEWFSGGTNALIWHQVRMIKKEVNGGR